MAKSNKKNRKSTITQSKSIETKTFFFEKERNVDYLLLAVTAIFLIVLLKPMVVNRLSPQGVDVVASKGQTHQISEYAKKTGEQALWNPAIFAGMPIYHRVKAKIWSPDWLLYKFSFLFSRVFIFYLLGAFGAFFIFRYLKFSPLLSFFGMLMFILMPHYKSLYLEGHMSKFDALMILPWVFLSFLYFIEKRNIFSIALFSLAFGVQIRTQHYQIVFYTGMLIFATGFYPILKDLLDKKYKRFINTLLMIIIAAGLGISLAAQPLFSAKEYIPYSKRGKTTININKQKTEQNPDKKGGVSIQYATQWSTAPSEMLTWLIPRFYGGMSNEKYTGNAVPQLKNRVLSGYWGEMPFTQSYEYMGILTLLLALIGLYANRKNKMIMSLFFLMIFFVLLSFGRHFETFYGLFYYYFPFFNKFRVPMMSVTVTSFLMSIFAVYGLKYITDVPKDKSISEYKPLLIIAGSFIALGILVWIFSMNMSFIKTGEQYNQQIQTLLIKIRKEYLSNDLTRYFILLFIGIGIIATALKNKIRTSAALLIIILISAADLVNIQARDTKNFSNPKKVANSYFRKNSADQYLLKDKEIYRIFPVGRLFGDNRWAYYHQIIGGYSAIKMFTIEELITNNIFNGPDRRLPFNWNVLKFLDVKYIVAQQPISSPLLKAVNRDDTAKLYTYLYNEHQKRAFFVGNYIVEPDEYKRLRLINNPTFDAAKTAILEEQMSTDIALPDSQQVKLTLFNPNKSVYEVYTDKTSLLVISELFYPPGWKISIDGKSVDKIYKTDHAVQSIVVPQGKHKIELLFHPDSYFRNVNISYASLSILYLLIIFGLYKEKGAELLRRRKSKE